MQHLFLLDCNQVLTSNRTGASGYIGGQALHAIATAHPELSFRALVRDSAKAKVITKAYPHVQTVAGSLSDEATLRKEVNEADIILSE